MTEKDISRNLQIIPFPDKIKGDKRAIEEHLSKVYLDFLDKERERFLKIFKKDRSYKNVERQD